MRSDRPLHLTTTPPMSSEPGIARLVGPSLDQLWATGTLVETRYRVDACLSQTTHARVYRVTDLLTGTVRVLKCSRGGDDRYARILARESALTARLHHAAVVRVYDSGRLPGGDTYYVVDWID